MKKIALFIIFLVGSSFAFASSMRHLHMEHVSANQPPGLHQQHMMPHGLQKQNKTPAGWTKGEKKGWHKHHWNKHHWNKHHHHMKKAKVPTNVKVND